MGEVSGIAWTDATFNPWWGCSRVSPGCENCYAETLATVRRKLPIWGVDAERKTMSEDYWRGPVRWNRKAAEAGARRRVFCASMCDVFELATDRNHKARVVMMNARDRLFSLIAATPHLDWLLLTKRPQNVRHLVPFAWLDQWPTNVWLGVTAEDQKRADERIPILINLPATVRFVSHEPALEAIDIARWLGPQGVNWVITGGESGTSARPYDVEWARGIIDQCRTADVSPFVKQLGRAPVLNGDELGDLISDRKGGEPIEWPADIRVREFPA